jgi:hypothetical protein
MIQAMPKLRKTIAPVQAGDFDSTPKEFGRTKDVETVYSIKRGSLYNAEKLGLVRGVLLRLRGQKSGLKLWDMASIAAWIRSGMEAKN